MLSREQIKKASTQEVVNEYDRAKEASLDLNKNNAWNEYLRALKKELKKRKGN
jgi:hypothetical protein